MRAEMGAMSVVSAGRGSNEEGVAAAAKCELHLRPLRPSAAHVERPGLPWVGGVGGWWGQISYGNYRGFTILLNTLC